MDQGLQAKAFEKLTVDEFKRIFNRTFWKAFARLPIALVNVPTQGNISKKQWEDLIQKEREELIESVYKSIKEKSYYPSTPSYYMIKNKGNGVVRVIPVFTAKDYCVYYYCIYRLEPIIAIDRVENTFGGWSLGGQIRAGEEVELKLKKLAVDEIENDFATWMDISAPSYSFNPNAWTKIYGDFNAKLFATAKISQHKYYAEFDISNFYDCVRLDILERKIRQRFDKEYEDDVTLLFHFLRFWNRSLNHYNSQTVGLPQDAMNDCSRILANYYLQEYDLYLFRACSEKDALYFRYSDDQFLFADSQKKLEYLVFKATKRLASLGLSVNQKKVKFGTVEDLIKYRSFDLYDKVSFVEGEEDFSRIEEYIDGYFELVDSKKIDEVKNEGINLLNRALSFSGALKKLPIAKRSRILSCYLNHRYLLEARTDQLDRIYQMLATDEEKVDFVLLLSRLSQESLHNYFHYQVLVFLKKYALDYSKIEARIAELSKE